MPPPPSKDASPPYLSFSTVKNFMDSFKEAGVPDRIDRTLLSGQSGTTQTYLLAALRFLGFIDEAGAPTLRMSKWHLNLEVEKEVYAEAIRESYSFLFDGSFRLEAATEGQIREKMKERDIQGDTARKAITFFVNACNFAGIPISPHLKGTRTVASIAGPKRGKRKKTGGSPPGDNPPPPIDPPLPPGMNVSILPLNTDRSRFIRLESPASVTTAELERIKQWMTFQLIVMDDDN